MDLSKYFKYYDDSIRTINDDFATKRITDCDDDVLGWMSRNEINELIQVIENI